MAGAYGWIGVSTDSYVAGVADTVEVIEIEQLANSRFGFMGGYGFGNLHVMGEYLMTTTEELNNDTTGVIDDVNGSSFYVQASYRCWNDKIGTLVRYEILDTDTDMNDNEITWTTIGVNYYLNSWKTMLYLNYMMRDAGDAYTIPLTGSYLEGLNDIILFQVQMAF